MPVPVDPTPARPPAGAPASFPPEAPASGTGKPTSYDLVPYPSFPFPQTHPDHLAVVGSLFGLTPARADRCRVLELGCAGGGNLIPLALSLPESQFVGIDLSAGQVAQAQKTADALGLKNIDLRHASILDVDDSYGPFDYIIAHGIYSWVPDEVKDKTLEIYAHRLGPDGIGFISYNTLPGWRVRGILRDLMRFHVSRFPGASPQQQVSASRAVTALLGRPKNRFGALMQEELELLQKIHDAVIFHNHLETQNDPLYFSEFVQRLTAHGLCYLGDVEPGTMIPWDFPTEIQQLLGGQPDQLATEQYLDFLRNRPFRQSMVGRARNQAKYNLEIDRATTFHVASPLRSASANLDPRSSAPERFVGPNNVDWTVSAPIGKAALLCLSEAWPQTLPFDQLLLRARVRLGPGRDAEQARNDAGELIRLLVGGFIRNATGLVELWQCPPRCVRSVSERPSASPLARLQAATGAQVTNQRHQTAPLSDLARHLLPLLDGTRDRAALLAALVQRFRDKLLVITQQGAPVTDEARARELLAQALDEQLPPLASFSLLVA